MKVLAVLLNVASFCFTALVLATDGAPGQAIYWVFTALLLAVPAFTVAVLVGGHVVPVPQGQPPQQGKTQPVSGPAGLQHPRAAVLVRTGVLANVILLGFLAWALVDQYPHPEEEGLVAYVLVVFFTPVMSIVALLWAGLRGRPAQAQTSSDHIAAPSASS